jgi:hypothetical protein
MACQAVHGVLPARSTRRGFPWQEARHAEARPEIMMTILGRVAHPARKAARKAVP